MFQMRARIMTFLYGILFVYVGLCAALFLLQRQLMYLPETDMGPPALYGLHDTRVFKIKAADDTALTGWYLPARDGFPTILYFHGNAGHLGHRSHKFTAFHEAGFGVLAVSYRGYGDSAGSPTEQGLYADARAALQYTRDVLHIAPQHMIFYGESMGTGVAVQMATETAPAALVLEAPYTSVEARSQELYPYMPVSLLIRDRYHSLDKISTVHAPLLIFHGDDDRVIPVRHGRTLLAAANAPKEGVFFPGIGHTDFDAQHLTNHLIEFLRHYAGRAFE